MGFFPRKLRSSYIQPDFQKLCDSEQKIFQKLLLSPTVNFFKTLHIFNVGTANKMSNFCKILSIKNMTFFKFP